MKKIFTIILAFMALALPTVAKESESTPMPITLRTHTTDMIPNPKNHRAPMRISVEAWYDALSETLTIYYEGETTGEVFLYRDGELIDTSSEINTTFIIPGSGYYTIEITTDNWIATGDFEI